MGPQHLVRCPNLLGNPVEFGTGWMNAPVRHQLERITGIAREHVDVHVKDFLKRDLAVREKEVDSLATYSSS
jgi:hypothetical protein